ncbi:hypothetical protein KGV55_02020 [Candidatus Gracilibacteria bacterium]|nr:hypothetical protein [Candidatus Gracilibacteria bacterium]
MNFSLLLTLIITIIELVIAFYSAGYLQVHFLNELYTQYSTGEITQTIFRGVLVFVIYFLISSIVGIFTKRLNQQSIDEFEIYLKNIIGIQREKEEKTKVYLKLIKKLTTLNKIRNTFLFLMIPIILIGVYIIVGYAHHIESLFLYFIFSFLFLIFFAGIMYMLVEHSSIIQEKWKQFQRKYMTFFLTKKEKEIQSTKDFQEFYQMYEFFKTYINIRRFSDFPKSILGSFLVIFIGVGGITKMEDIRMIQITGFICISAVIFLIYLYVRYSIFTSLALVKIENNSLYKKYFPNNADTIQNIQEERKVLKNMKITGKEENLVKKSTFSKTTENWIFINSALMFMLLGGNNIDTESIVKFRIFCFLSINLGFLLYILFPKKCKKIFKSIKDWIKKIREIINKI